MPVILETISWILKNVNVGVDRLIVGYGVRFVYSVPLQKGHYPMVKGEIKGKRNEASQPRLDIIFSTSYAFSKNIFIDIGLDPDMYRDT